VKLVGLQLENISKTWQGFALKNINLTVNDGDYFIILGPTGAGKTLLLETIMGFNKPDIGRILINGLDVTSELPEKRKIGYVPQNVALFPHMTVRQNIEFGLKMHNIAKTERQKKLDPILQLLKLEKLESRKPTTLSGGEKQKVSLARVLAIDPKLILLDEPLTSVDAETGRDLRKELKHINKDHGKTVVHVTHNLVEGYNLADRAALMKAGEIVQTGKVQEVFSKPSNVFAAKFLGWENIFNAKVLHSDEGFSDLEIDGVRLRVAGKIQGTEKTVAIRPEDIEIQQSPTKDKINTFEGTLVDHEEAGYVAMITVDVGFLLKVIVTKRAFVKLSLEEGKRVWLQIKDDVIRIVE
jgi:ABC-type Fe3+/spermidine/putrescine transport system ATPase subunit